jgi:hypothetical protein
MALPLPRVVPDTGPGGGLVTAMGGMNALHGQMLQNKMNKIKNEYLPLTLQAQAASQLAYAKLMGPQYVAKLLQNDGVLANLPDAEKKALLGMVTNAGVTATQGGNALGQMPQQQPPQHTGVGQPSTNNFSGMIKNALMGLLGKGQGQGQAQGGNPFSNAAQSMPQMPQQQPMGMPQGGMPQGNPAMNATPSPRPKDGVTLEGQQWYNKKGEPVYAEEEQVNEPGDHAMELELTQGQRPERPRTWEENTGTFKGTVKEGEELGKHRAEAINDIGQQQMQLSNTGANLDRIIDDINDPKFMALRKDFPFYQDMQLKGLSKIGTPEQQEMIGNFIADVKSFAGATVNSFKGQSMKREFDYADQLKPNENDTVASARGKLTALKALKEIGQKKNDIILDLMQDKHMNLGDAVKQANKMVDTKAIGQQVKELTQPKVTLKNKKTGVSITVTLNKARELGVPNV